MSDIRIHIPPNTNNSSSSGGAAAAHGGPPIMYDYDRAPSGVPPPLYQEADWPVPYYESIIRAPSSSSVAVPPPPPPAAVPVAGTVAITIPVVTPTSSVRRNQWMQQPAVTRPPAPKRPVAVAAATVARMPAPPAAVPVMPHNDGYASSFIVAPTSTGVETRAVPRLRVHTWTPPPWWRNPDGTSKIDAERVPPAGVVIPNRLAAHDVGGTHYYHCFDRCLFAGVSHALCYCDRHPWLHNNGCVPVQDPIGGVSSWCRCYWSDTDRTLTNPGYCPSPWHWILIVLMFPFRVAFIAWLNIPLLIASFFTDLLVYVWTTIWFCDGLKGIGNGRDGDHWCSWSFGVMDHRNRGQRFRYPGCWLTGCLQIWCCMITSRQRHYSICPSLFPDPTDNEYLALRLPDIGAPLHVSCFSRCCSDSIPCHPYSNCCSPTFAML